MTSEPSASSFAANKAGGIKGLLGRLVRDGQLTLIDWKGRRHRFGTGYCGHRATIRLRDRWLPWKLLLRPTLSFGEAHMDGRLTVERGEIRTVLAIVTSDLRALDKQPLQRLGTFVARLWRKIHRNGKARSRRNVAHHYDLSGELYRLFLDRDMQYSCAYFPTGRESLEEAQAAKKRHLAAKLLLEPGSSLLDIGCGWGGLALEFARNHGARVKGITLSTEQLEAARKRATAEGLDGRARFELQDYREVAERFDRIVSIGMFEHVGSRHYAEFFEAVARNLKPDGVALIHSIGRRSPPGAADPWICKYIFPGAYIPALSEVMAAVEKSGLWAADIEILRLHYAETLRHWYERFQARRAEARALYDERFCRMWEFYLSACEMMFRNGELMVFQLQLAHRPDAVPLTRDYISRAEQAPMGAGSSKPRAGPATREPAPVGRARARAKAPAAG